MRVCETICLNEAEFTSLGPGVDDLPGLMADASDADASPRRGEGTRTPELTLSVLDLVPVGSGSTPAHALRNSVELARLADRLGYARYWFAEHHGMPGMAHSGAVTVTVVIPPRIPPAGNAGCPWIRGPVLAQ